MGYILFGVLLSVAYWIYFVLKFDKVEREPLRTVIGVGIGGAFLSVGGTLIYAYGMTIVFTPLMTGLDSHANVFLSFADGMHIGLYEEFFKMGAAILLISTLKDFNEPADAVIYAMTVGLGFAAVENVMYAVTHGIGILVIRSVISMPVHMACAAVWGYGIAKARYVTGGSILKTAWPYWLASAALHGVFDFAHFLKLGGTFTLAFVVLFTGGMMEWTKRKLKYLVSQSPFLMEGKCPECGSVNDTEADECFKCKTVLVRDFIKVEVDKDSGVPVEVIRKQQAVAMQTPLPPPPPATAASQSKTEPDEE